MIEGETVLDLAYRYNNSPIQQEIIALLRLKGGKANYFDENGFRTLYQRSLVRVKNHVKSFTIAKRPLNIHLIFIEIFFSNADRGSLMSFFSA